MKKLFIMLLSVLLLVGCNPDNGGDEPVRPGAVKLNGEATVTITVGDTYSELGAYVDGDTSIEITITGTVNTALEGSYEITYSYDSNGVKISTIRTVIVEEETINPVIVVTCTLNGNGTINIDVEDSFQDPGVTCTPATTEVTITDNVDIYTPGNYQVEYEYMSETGLKTLTRNVVVSPSMSNISFSLNDSNEVYIDQGDTWVDPGYQLDGSSASVTVTGTVNTDVPGFYILTYSFTDGMYVELTRNVIVVRTVFYAFNSSELVEDDLTVTITGYDITLKYDSLVVELYQDDIMLDFRNVIDGLNTLTFTGLTDGHDYVVKIRGDYFDDTTAMYDEETVDTFTIESLIIVPTMTVTNEIIDESSYSFDYVINDTESRFLWFNVKTYDGVTIVDTQDSIVADNGTISITGLDDYKDYKVVVIITYDEGTTNLETTGLDKNIETFLEFSLTAEVDKPTVYQDEANFVTITITNSNGHTVEHIYIDGVDTLFTTVNSTTYTIDLDTSVIGVFDKTIDELTLSIRTVSETFIWDTEFTYEVVDQLASENVPYVIAYFSNDDEYSTSGSGSGHTMELRLYNPLQLPISDIYLNDVLYNSNFYSNTGEVITFYSNFSYEQQVTQFSYEFGGVTYQVDVDSFNVENMPVCDGIIHQITTVQHVKDMLASPYGCWELMNDIDLTGEDWLAIVNAAPDGSLTLFGNGYTISNITMVSIDVTQSSETNWGFFGVLNGSHIQDLILDVNISIGNSNVNKPNMFIGGLAGYISSSHIENVTVNGNVDSNYYYNGAIGAIVGMTSDSVFEDVSSSVTMDITQYTPTLESRLGSLIGEIDGTDIHGYTENSTITVTGISSHVALFIGEPIGKITDGDVLETP
ncbi:hypothetical protein KQ51_00057 [Candidatus Izimaplasma bacterium HR1]|jgi:uncharacterized protein YcfL|uniref:immunoglobulin-like domain-containing protein n=1 Tax=Candidatus Izimoplasma sp. HR1 TaxID=1541959 RepID=UPI0004F83084|nr:hypothetical protein KQ51_00057 [Candidatus Izimaplasma bacterium HR1]